MLRLRPSASARVPLLLGLATALGACSDEQARPAEIPSSSCTREDLRLARDRDTISDTCRKFLRDLLPKPKDDLDGTVRIASTRTVDGVSALSLVGLPLAGLDDASTLDVSSDGGETFTGVPLRRAVEGEVAASLVTDYSASMRDTDLAAAETLNGRLWRCVPKGTQSQVLVFSNEVKERKGFEDPAEGARVTGVDPTVRPKLTALHTALVKASDALGRSSASVRLLFAQTDGRENVSKYTTDEVRAAFLASNVVPLVAGTFVADVPRIEALVNGRGLFLYTRSIADFPYEKVCSYLASPRVITVDVTRAATRLRARIGNAIVELQPAR